MSVEPAHPTHCRLLEIHKSSRPVSHMHIYILLQLQIHASEKEKILAIKQILVALGSDNGYLLLTLGLISLICKGRKIGKQCGMQNY